MLFRDKITAEQIAALEAQSDTTLAEWWCVLNRWKWPEGLSDAPHPPIQYEANDARAQLMHWIDDKVGHKFILRHHNREMPDEVFESFWRGEREESTPYGRYAAVRTAKRMKLWEERQEAILASDHVLDDVLDADEIDA